MNVSKPGEYHTNRGVENWKNNINMKNGVEMDKEVGYSPVYVLLHS